MQNCVQTLNKRMLFAAKAAGLIALRFNRRKCGRYNSRGGNLISKVCHKILIFGYAALAILYFYASINNAYENIYGNRTIGAIILLTYFSIMVTGLIKRSVVFSLVSILNFILGTVFFVWLVSVGLPQISIPLLIYTFLGILGIIISAMSFRFRNAL